MTTAAPEAAPMSVVEQTLRAQRGLLREIVERARRDFKTPAPPERLLLFGLGSSHYVARLVAHTLVRARGRAPFTLLPCTALAVGGEVVPRRGDLAIAFSHRGKNKPTLAALELCRRAGAATAFVSAQGAAVPGSADWLLPSGPLERCEPHSIAITGAVCAATTWLLGAEAAAEWRGIGAQADPDLGACRETVGEGPTILLGEHVAEWVAREGALKFIEIARHPARALGSEEFFHGTSWGLKPDDRIWHVALPDDARTPEIEARRRLAVGPAPLAWVPALIELQWLALALALNRGEDPDDPVGAARRAAAR